jgi:3'-5' exoribonuclease
LTLKLLDRSGEIEARIWDRADDLGRGFERNDFVRVRGQASRTIAASTSISC